jgi:hypothetical protein
MVRFWSPVIGGLPAGFVDSPLSDDELTAIQAVFRDQGAEFLETPEGGRYPRSAFFDTADHLNESAQISHSVAVARALARVTGLKLAWGRRNRPAAPVKSNSRETSSVCLLPRTTKMRPCIEIDCTR